MRQQMDGSRLPKIAITDIDFETLSRLGNAALDSMPEVAEELLGELDRAKIVLERLAKPKVVRMGSTLSYRTEDGTERRVTLVYPADADISVGKVSIMTPIGAALIGLSEGQSITWANRSGKRQMLTVTSVEPPPVDNVDEAAKRA
ncbi:nucleoside diphosphate kinase regulator [Aureimonas sp. Leaf454]|uniref:nucleoside diphosphate kinase regulator n=1 Tax=Aureimonas sp. Leaf454 TaxID=1736381 RepID=UPI000A67FD71